MSKQPEPPRNRHHNEQCPALLKSRPGFRCQNVARYPLDPDKPDGLWLVCGVHRRLREQAK